MNITTYPSGKLSKCSIKLGDSESNSLRIHLKPTTKAENYTPKSKRTATFQDQAPTPIPSKRVTVMGTSTKKHKYQIEEI